MTEPARTPTIVKIPPPVWALTMLLIAYGLWQAFDWASIVYAQSTPLAIGFGLVGVGLAFWAVRTFSAVGAEIAPPSPSNKVLATGGPFRLIRDPMYSALVLMVSGVALYFGTLPFFAVPVIPCWSTSPSFLSRRRRCSANSGTNLPSTAPACAAGFDWATLKSH